MSGIFAVVPVKETQNAKQRLATVAPARLRQELALAMFEDVLSALAGVPGLAGIVVVTLDADARAIAAHHRAECWADGAREGHTGAVSAAVRRLVAAGEAGMLTVPGDIPLVTSAEIGRLIAAHRPAPSFTIAPAHDEMGSNAILMSPPDAVPLRFGDNSYFPHLAAARARGIEPTVVRLPGIGFDIDNPEDLAHFAQLGSRTRAGRLLADRTLSVTPAKAGV